MAPWNSALPDTQQARINANVDDNAPFDETPLYLGHTRWKQAQGTPRQRHSNLPGNRTDIRETTPHQKSRSRTRRNVQRGERLCQLFVYDHTSS